MTDAVFPGKLMQTVCVLWEQQRCEGGVTAPLSSSDAGWLRSDGRIGGVAESRECTHEAISGTGWTWCGGGICNPSTWEIKREGKALKNILSYIVNLRSAWAT